MAIYQKYRKLLGDFGFVSFAKIMDILIPLVTYPYLISTLGAENYGGIIYQLAIIDLIAVVIVFGFDLSGVKFISKNIDDFVEVQKIYSNIIILKLVFLVFSIFFYFLFFYIHSWNLISVILGICLVQHVFVNDWYYVGMERIKISVIIRFIVRLLFLFSVFYLINDDGDTLKLAYIYAANSLIISLLYFFHIVVFEKIRFKFPQIIDLKETIYNGFDLFYSNFFVAVKDKSAILVIGKIYSNEFVVIYDFCLKVNTVISIPIGVLNTLIYPKIVKDRDLSHLKNTILFSLMYSTFVLIAFSIVISKISLSYFDVADSYKIVVYMFLIIPVIMSISLAIARNFLNALGFRREYYLSINLTTIYHFSVMSMPFILNGITFEWFIIGVISIFLFELLVRLYLYKTVMRDKFKYE